MNYYNETILALQGAGFERTGEVSEPRYAPTTQDFLTGKLTQGAEIGVIFTEHWTRGGDSVSVVSEGSLGGRSRGLRGWRLHRDSKFTASGKEHRKLARLVKGKAAA